MYTEEQIMFGLKNMFIQFHVKTNKDFQIVEEICKKLKCKNPCSNKNQCFVFGQIFNDKSFGLNANFDPKKNLTIITN